MFGSLSKSTLTVTDYNRLFDAMKNNIGFHIDHFSTLHILHHNNLIVLFHITSHVQAFFHLNESYRKTKNAIRSIC